MKLLTCCGCAPKTLAAPHGWIIFCSMCPNSKAEHGRATEPERAKKWNEHMIKREVKNEHTQ